MRIRPIRRISRFWHAGQEWWGCTDTTWLYSVLAALPPKRLSRRLRLDDRSLAFRLAVRSTLFASIFYVGGLFIALGGGFLPLYVWQTSLIYLTVIGIGWVAFWGGWADQRLRDFHTELTPAFLQPGAYRDLYRRDLKHLFSRPRHIGWSSFWMFLLWAYVAYAIFHRGTFTVISDDWATGSKWLKMLTLWWLLVPSTWLSVTMLIGARDYSGVVKRVAKLPLVLPSAVARVRLRPLVNWGVATGFGWTAGLTLVIFLFRFVPGLGGESPHGAGLIAPVVFLTFAALWGAGFLVMRPQYNLHVALREAKVGLLDELTGRMKVANPADGLRDPVAALHKARTRHVQSTLDDPTYEHADRLARELSTSSEWIFSPPGEILLFVGQAILPIVALVISLSVPHK